MMTSSTTLVLLAIAFLTGAGGTWLVMSYARQRIMAVPESRSSHSHPVPTAGGVGFVAAFVALAMIAAALDVADLEHVTAVGSVSVPLAVVGFLDDRVPLPRYSRLPVQVIAAAFAVWYFGALYLPVGDDAESVRAARFVFSVIGVTAVINFYNFMDGIDGLLASTVAAQLGFLGWWLNQPLWWLMSAALVGFLVFNWPPARVFMGDAGSTVLGAVTAIAVIGHEDSVTWRWYFPVVCLPIAGDALYTIARRALRRENIILAHHSHIYQRLVRAGWSHARTTLVYLALTVAVAASVDRLGLAGACAGVGLCFASIVSAELYFAHHRVPFAK